MNILHIMKDYKPNVGGSVVRNSSMIESYHKNFGHQDKVVILDLDGLKYPKYSIEKNIEVYREINLFNMLKTALKIISNESIDIIHAHNFRFLLVSYLAKILTNKKVRLVVEIHSVYNMSKPKEWLSYWLLKRADLVSVLSESAKRYLIDVRNIDSKMLIVLRNGINEGAIKTADSGLLETIKEINKKYCIIAYTGSFISWQGVRFLADSFDDISKEFDNIFLLMLGDGEEFPYVENTVKKSSNAERCIVHKGIGKEELNGIMPYIDIVIIPREKNLSTNTAVPLKVIEAMQLGKCIVAGDDNGLTELLNGKNSKIFESYNLDSLKRELSVLVNNPLLRQKLGLKAKEDAKKYLMTWNANVRILRERYIELL